MSGGDVTGLFRKVHEDKRSGKKRVPLNTLTEIAEALGIDHRTLGKEIKADGNAPPCVLNGKAKGYRTQAMWYEKRAVVAWWHKRKLAGEVAQLQTNVDALVRRSHELERMRDNMDSEVMQ